MNGMAKLKIRGDADKSMSAEESPNSKEGRQRQSY
jgi:hypothetical protein